MSLGCTARGVYYIDPTESVNDVPASFNRFNPRSKVERQTLAQNAANHLPAISYDVDTELFPEKEVRPWLFARVRKETFTYPHRLLSDLAV